MAHTRYPSSQVSFFVALAVASSPGLRGGGGRKTWGRGYSSLAVIHDSACSLLCDCRSWNKKLLQKDWLRTGRTVYV